MSRQQRRKKNKKARREERERLAAADAEAMRLRLPLPSLFPNGTTPETRDLRTRWQNLTARGGLRISFVPVGPKIPVDFSDPMAEHALALSLVQKDETEN